MVHANTNAAAVKVMRLAGFCAKLLAKSPFRRPSTWPLAVVVMTPEERRVVPRGELAASLRTHDLAALASEVASRKVPHGCILIYGVLDDEQAAVARFGIVDIARGEVRQ